MLRAVAALISLPAQLRVERRRGTDKNIVNRDVRGTGTSIVKILFTVKNYR